MFIFACGFPFQELFLGEVLVGDDVHHDRFGVRAMLANKHVVRLLFLYYVVIRRIFPSFFRLLHHTDPVSGLSVTVPVLA